MLTILRKLPLKCVRNFPVVIQSSRAIKQRSELEFPSENAKGKMTNDSSFIPADSVGTVVQDYVTKYGSVLNLSVMKPELFSKFPNINNNNFDAIFIRACTEANQFALAQNFLKLIKEEGRKPNLATLSHYLRLCHKCPNEVTNVEEVKQICRELFSHGVLNYSVVESIILGLCVAREWKEGFAMLPKLEELQPASGIVLNELMLCAIRDQDLESLLILVKKAIHFRKAIRDSVYESWIDLSSHDEQFLKSLLSMLSENEIFPSSAVAEKLKATFENHKGLKYSGTYTTIDHRTGKCQHCLRSLKPVILDDEQYSTLRDAILKAMCGKDMFVGSTPEEIEMFKNFLDSNTPFDMVIDGLNISYLQGSKLNSTGKLQQLLNLVSHFYRMDKRILVMIRKHVLKWSGASKLIPEIRKKAQLFAVDNLSRDDLFILYGTVRGGRGAQFVSEDLMRNHMFNLKDSRLEVLFRQWLRMSQVRIVKILNNGRVITEPMPRVFTITQSEGKNWHIPYNDGTVLSKFEIPNTWLCLKHLK